MASYLYSKVQEAIGGKSTSSGFQKNWSPNKIRALYLMRDFILVVNHGSSPVVTSLDMSEVGLDLQNPNRVGSLNNLLSSRQLSCLEEIYADEAFARVPNVLDLQAYANSVISSTSRLRYYAYTSGLNRDTLVNCYRQVLMNGTPDFTYAKNIGGIRYVDTGNTDWYKKYNLRPQYYGPDADNGQLAVWFRKVEKLVGEAAGRAEAAGRLEAEKEVILNRIMLDINDLPYFRELRDISKYCSESGYDMYKGIGSIIRSEMKVDKASGLTKEKAISCFGSNRPAELNSLLALYDICGVFTKGAESGAEGMDGYLNVAVMLDKILASVYEKYGNSRIYKYVVRTAMVNSFKNGIPKGSLYARVKDMAKGSSMPLSAAKDSYMSMLKTICGMGGN